MGDWITSFFVSFDQQKQEPREELWIPYFLLQALVQATLLVEAGSWGHLKARTIPVIQQ